MNKPLFHYTTIALFAACTALTVGIAVTWVASFGWSPILVVFITAFALACIPAYKALRMIVDKSYLVDSEQAKIEALKQQDDLAREYLDQLVADEDRIRQLELRIIGKIEQTKRLLAMEEPPPDSLNGLTRAIEVLDDGSLSQCRHPIAKSLATIKAQSCRDADIDPDFSLVLPDSLPIPSVDLCSVLGNLIDNGIKAITALPQHEGLSLSVRTYIKKGHLLIDVRNPICSEDHKKLAEFATKPKEALNALRRLEATSAAMPKTAAKHKRITTAHGWGHSIVESIARKHGGALLVDLHDDWVRHVVVIPLLEQEQDLTQEVRR